MVRRSSDAPRTLPTTVQAAHERLDELARAQGRGTTALRDSSGNKIIMNADAPYPLLRPQGVDGSMAFGPDGTVKIISPDTLEDRDLTARGVAASGHLTSDTMGTNLLGVGTVNAARYTAGPVNIDGNGILTPGIGVGGLGDFGRITCGPVNIDPNGIASPGVAVGGTIGAGRSTMNNAGFGCPGGGFTSDPNGGMYSLNYYGGYFRGVVVPPPSERALKDHVEDIDPGQALEVVRRWSPARYRWKEPPATDEPRLAAAGAYTDDLTHAGLYVDELDDTAPELVWAPEQQDDDRAEGRTYEDRGVLAYLTAAVQALAADRDALRDEVAALTARLEGPPAA